MIKTYTVTVGTVRPGRARSAFFTGKDERGVWLRFALPPGTLFRIPLAGETWTLKGTVKFHPIYGNQLHITSGNKVTPYGRLLVHLLIHHPAFRGIGIGQTKVLRLWEVFGVSLYTILNKAETDKLKEVLSEDSAGKLISAWRENNQETEVLQFLDTHGFDVKLANTIRHIWGTETIDKLRENPYRMLAFAGWRKVDDAALILGISPDDVRRQIAAVEAVLYRRLDQKHTVTDQTLLLQGISSLLNVSDQVSPKSAIQHALDNRAAILRKQGEYQPLGAWVMEDYLSRRFKQLVCHDMKVRLPLSPNGNSTTFAVESAFRDFEKTNGFGLNIEQQLAVRMAIEQPLGVLTGSAGVGKTAVLKAIHMAVEKLGGEVFQMALAGRAAQRMKEATGRDACTIASFIHQVRKGLRLRPNTLVIIDESSMIDLPLMYRILRYVPECIRLLFVGDPYQLPPIGFGLVFHVLVNSSEIPKAELTKVHRHTTATGIPQIAQEIRQGQIPSFAQFSGPTQGVSFIDSATEQIIRNIIDVAKSLACCDDVQILGVTKAGDAGVETINDSFHRIAASGNPSIPDWDFAETEPVIHLINDYDRELFNGSLGRIKRIVKQDSKHGRISYSVECEFEGRMQTFEEDSFDRISLAHAITVHKAQGSQFKKVLIPVVGSRLLDRTLIYTALTRGIEQVVFIGQRVAVERAIIAEPHSHSRQIGLEI